MGTCEHSDIGQGDPDKGTGQCTQVTFAGMIDIQKTAFSRPPYAKMAFLKPLIRKKYDVHQPPLLNGTPVIFLSVWKTGKSND